MVSVLDFQKSKVRAFSKCGFFRVCHARVRLPSLVLLSLLVAGCGGITSTKGKKIPELPPAIGVEKANVEVTAPPWELWAPGITFDNESIGTTMIRDGDAEIVRNNPAAARSAYQRAQGAPLSATEREAVAYRIASCYLREGNSSGALAELSSYFHKSRIEAGTITTSRALFLGYAYGQSGNIDQSLAWFATSVGRSSDLNVRDRAQRGAREVIHTLHPDRFEELAEKWKGSGIIREAFAQERTTRARSGYVFTARRPFMPSVLPSSASTTLVERDLTPSSTTAAPLSVLVLLPLTGKHAPLGIATRQGIELSFRDNGSLGNGSSVNLVVEDSTLDVATAVSKVEQSVSTLSVAAIIGPLISELTDPVAEKARSLGVPVLTLSKRGNLTTGNGVFRLGITVQSQVSRLIEEAHLGNGINRYALVFPETEAGFEYAESTRRELTARGLTLSYDGSYREGDSGSLARIATQLETAQVGGVIFPGKPTDAGVLFSSISSEVRATLRPLGFVTWSQVRDMRQSQNALNGALVVSPFYLESSRPVVQTFVEAYKASFTKTPDFLAAQGFDAAMLAAMALREAVSNGVSFSAGLGAVSTLEGITGRLSITPSGEVNRQFAVLEFQNGGFIERSLNHVLVAPQTDVTVSPISR